MKILVPLDGSQLAEQVLPYAISFGRRFATDMYFLQVIDGNEDADKPLDALDWELRRARCDCYLDGVKLTLAEHGIEAECAVVQGDAATEIVEFCGRHDIDLLILSGQGAGAAERFVRGGTARKILSQVDRSVLIVNSPAPALTGDLGYRRILVAVDGSGRSDWALNLAATIAVGHGAELELLHVVEEPRVSPRVRESAEGRGVLERLVDLNRREAYRRLDEIKVSLPKDLATRFRVVVAPDVAAAIDDVATSGEADLTILSAHGWSVQPGQPLSPIAEALVAHASRPVLVLQDALDQEFVLKPAAGVPARSARVERRQSADAG